MNSTNINVIQFGTGNFLRAFIEPVFQNLKEKGLAYPKICIIESTGSGKVKAMAEVDFKYPVWTTGVENGETINKVQTIDCVEMGLSLPQEHEQFLKLAKNSDLEWIISNVTEAGFVLEEEGNANEFPKSFPARLTLLLLTRYEHFQGDSSKGLEILPCELVEKNGEKLKEMVLSQAKDWKLDQAFFHWLEYHNTYYTSLVDRIVPGKPSIETLDNYQAINLDHPFLVQAEPYFLLAVQGEPSKKLNLNIFNSDFPVLKVESVEEYATRKVRVLNGSHIAMVVLGLPQGIETVSEFMENEILFSKLEGMIEEEVLPHIPQDETELLNYSKAIWDRFRNPFVKHKLSDISLNTMAKLSPRILESIAVFYASEGHMPARLSNILVSALVNYLTTPEKIRDTDTIKEIFKEARKIKNPDEKAEFLLSHPGLWDRDLRSFVGLKEALAQRLG